MNRRVMKKRVPKNTIYCQGCKNSKFVYIGKDEMIIPVELGSKDFKYVPVKYKVFKCMFMGVLTDEDTLLANGCKICGVGEPNIDYYSGE